MENIFGSVHYNSIAVWMKDYFGQRMVKLSIDAGLSCPNRDGRCGTGGCIYCSESGSGDFASDIPAQIRLTQRKWPDAAYLAYFQNHTNTYAPVSTLRKLWDRALSYPGIKGLVIATRPDCLGDNILELLKEYNEKTFLWIELGLQTESDLTARRINRCYETRIFEEAMIKLKAAEIRVVVHEILGLPGEDYDQMLRTSSFVNSFEPFGIKLHMMHIMEGTILGELYKRQQKKAGIQPIGADNISAIPPSIRSVVNPPNKLLKGLPENIFSVDFPEIQLLSLDEYVNVVTDILEETPQSITIHRLTGDAPRNLLLAPQWTSNKHIVLGAIQHQFSIRGSFQGSRISF